MITETLLVKTWKNQISLKLTYTVPHIDISVLYMKSRRQYYLYFFQILDIELIYLVVMIQ